MNSLNDLECRTKRLEACLLPKPDFLPDIFDALVAIEQSIGVPPELSQEEVILAKYGDKETWCNDMRSD